MITLYFVVRVLDDNIRNEFLWSIVRIFLMTNFWLCILSLFSGTKSCEKAMDLQKEGPLLPWNQDTIFRPQYDIQQKASEFESALSGVVTSVDSEYLLTRVLTREYLFFDTFWDSSLLELDFSFLKILERVEY